MSERRKERDGTPAAAGFFYVATNFLTKAISLFLSPVFTRLLEPSEYGLYSLYLTWSGILTVTLSLGISGGVIYRALGKFANDEEGLIGTAIASQLPLPALLLSATVLFPNAVFRITGLEGALNLLVIGEASLTSAEAVIFAHGRYRYRYREICAVNLLRTLISQGTALLFISLFGVGGEGRIYSSFLSSIILIAPRAVHYLGRRGVFSRGALKYLLRLSIPLMPNAIALTLIAQSDKIMIENMLGISELGKYSVAYSVGFMLTVVTGAAYSALQPWLMRKLNSGSEASAREFTDGLIRLSTLGLLVFTLLVPEIFGIIAAPEYREAEAAVYPLAVAGLLQFISNLLSANIIHTERTGILSVFSLLALALNLLLNYALIPTFGYLAAAFTTAIAYAALVVLEELFISRRGYPRLVARRALFWLFLLLFTAPIYLIRRYLPSRLILAAALLLIAAPTLVSLVREYRKRHTLRRAS